MNIGDLKLLDFSHSKQQSRITGTHVRCTRPQPMLTHGLANYPGSQRPLIADAIAASSQTIK